MARFTKVKKKEFLELYIENDFHLTKTCKEVGITRKTFYYAKDVDLEFADSIIALESRLNDILFGFIMEGLNDPESRLAYLRLMSSQKIDQIMTRVANKEISRLVNKDDIVLG